MAKYSHSRFANQEFGISNKESSASLCNIQYCHVIFEEGCEFTTDNICVI